MSIFFDLPTHKDTEPHGGIAQNTTFTVTYQLSTDIILVIWM